LVKKLQGEGRRKHRYMQKESRKKRCTSGALVRENIEESIKECVVLAWRECMQQKPSSCRIRHKENG
jgi:hypothetical protein